MAGQPPGPVFGHLARLGVWPAGSGPGRTHVLRITGTTAGAGTRAHIRQASPAQPLAVNPLANAYGQDDFS